ncbi:MAG: translocation/assembly module TamB domain-containing protein [Acidobacteriota bacterium]
MKRRHILGRAGKVVVYAAAVAGTAGAIALFAWLIVIPHIVLPRLLKSMGLVLEVGSTDFDPWEFRVVMQDLRLSYKGMELLRARTASADLNISGWGPVIDASLDTPVFTIVRDSDGNFRIPDLGPQRAGHTGKQVVRLRSVSVVDGTVHYSDQKTGMSVEMHRITADLRSGSPYTLTLSSPSCRSAFRGHEIQGAARLSAVLADPLLVNRFEFDTDGLVVRLTDQRIDPQAPKFEADGEVHLEALERWLPEVSLKEHGGINGAASFRAELDVPAGAVALSASSDALRVAAVDLRDCRIEATASTKGRTTAKVTARLGGGRAAGDVSLSPGRNRASVTFSEIDPRLLPPIQSHLPVGLATAAGGRLDASWGRSGLRAGSAQGKIDLEPLKAGPRDVSLGGQFEAAYENGSLTFMPSELDVGGGTSLQVEGVVASGATDLKVTTRVVNVRGFMGELRKWTPGLPESLRDLAGSLVFTGRCEGSWRRLIGTFRAPRIGFKGMSVSELGGTLSVDGGRVDVSDVRGRAYGGTVSGRAEIDGGRLTASVVCESLDLHSISPVAEAGTLGLTARGEGVLDDPSFSGDFLIDRLATSQTTSQSFRGGFLLDSREFSADYRARDHDLAGTARLTFASPYPLHLTGSFTSLPVSQILTLYQKHPTTQVLASGQVDGNVSLENPRSSNVRIGLDSLGYKTAGVDLRSDGLVSVEVTPEAVEFEQFRMIGPGQELDLCGTLPLSAGGEADLRVDGVASLQPLEILSPGLKLGGTVSGEAVLSGAISALTATGSFALNDASIEHPRLPFPVLDTSGTLRLDGTLITLEGVGGRLRSGTFGVSGVVPLEALPLGLQDTGSGVDLKIEMRSVGSAEAGDLIPQKVRDSASFTTDIDLAMTGNLQSLSAITLDGEIADARLKTRNRTLTSPAGPWKLSKHGDLLTIDGAHLSGDGLELSGDFRMSLGRQGDGLHASLRASAENRILQDFVPNARFGGKSRLELTIDADPLAEPPKPLQTSGGLTIEAGSATFLGGRLEISSVAGGLNVTAGQLKGDFTGALNGGTSELSGRARLQGTQLSDLSMDVAFDNCGVFFPDGLRGTLEGLLRVHRAPEEGYILEGDVWLRNGEYRKNIGLQKQILAGLKKKPTEQAAPPFKDLKLDVRLSPVGDIRIRNNMADLRLQGDLAIQGTVENPLPLGQVRTMPKGTFFFQGRSYQVLEGSSLSFLGDAVFDPRFDVKATVSVRVPEARGRAREGPQTEHTIAVDLGGQLSDLNPVLRDTSISPLSETQIVSLLLTGQLIGEGAAYTKDDFKNQMARFLGGGVGNIILPAIGRQLGIDQFDIRANEISTVTNQPVARVVIGKDLGHGFFFQYSPELSNTERYYWKLEYQLNRNVSFAASRLDDASYVGSVTYGLGFNLRTPRAARPPITLGEAPLNSEKGRLRIRRIVIDGIRTTNSGLVIRQLTFQAGDVFDYKKLIESQRRLYDLFVFRSVRIYPEATDKERGLVDVRVSLIEHDVYQFASTMRYSTEGKIAGTENTQNPGGVDAEFELHNVNLFGRGIDAGVFTRQSRKERDYRLMLTLPYFFRRKATTTALLYRTRIDDDISLQNLYGASFQVEHKVRQRYRLQYFYNYKKTRLTVPPLFPGGEPLQFDVNRARIGTSFIAELRDDPLDAKRGLFGSITVEYHPTALGSDLRLLKSSAQLALYYTPFRGITFAINNRAGVMDTYGELLLESDAFYLGGSSTVRSFDEELLGPRSPFNPKRAAGGRAFVVYNQEVRFPIRQISESFSIRGVVFHDAGNVFQFVRNFRPLDLRSCYGIGLRFGTPYSVFRLDYALTVNPQPEDNRYRFVFGLWQMF